MLTAKNAGCSRCPSPTPVLVGALCRPCHAAVLAATRVVRPAGDGCRVEGCPRPPIRGGWCVECERAALDALDAAATATDARTLPREARRRAMEAGGGRIIYQKCLSCRRRGEVHGLCLTCYDTLMGAIQRREDSLVTAIAEGRALAARYPTYCKIVGCDRLATLAGRCADCDRDAARKLRAAETAARKAQRLRRARATATRAKRAAKIGRRAYCSVYGCCRRSVDGVRCVTHFSENLSIPG